jgi:sugar-specific transcriptional regulator TrmB
MLSEVESELMIAIPIFSEGLSEAIYPALTHLSSIGVKILFLASNRVVKKSIKKIAGVAAVRLRDQMFGGGVIADGKEALLLLSEKEEPVIGIFSDHTGLVKFAKDYFRYLWEDATNLAC